MHRPLRQRREARHQIDFSLPEGTKMRHVIIFVVALTLALAFIAGAWTAPWWLL